MGGEKSVEVAAGWLDRCTTAQLPYFGPGETAVREVFTDHRLIAELGCGSVINVPVVGEHGTLDVLNLLDAPGAYRQSQVQRAGELAALAAHALSELVQRIDEPEEAPTP